MKEPASTLTPTVELAKADTGATIAPVRYRVLRSGKQMKGLLPIVLFFVLWELLSRGNNYMEWFNPVFLPPPSEIAQDGWTLWKSGIIFDSLVSSTGRIAAGFLIGTAIALIVAVWMSRFAAVEQWLGPVLNLIGPIPALALLPIFIIWLGIGEFPKVLLIAWTTFIPMLAYTLDGLKSVQPTLIRSALSLGAAQRHIFFKVTLPSALPNVFVGMQVSLGLAFSSLIVSEMMGAKKGLGYIIVDARNFFKMSNMFVAIVLIGLEYSLFSFLLKRLERKVIRWRGDGIRSAVEK